MSPSQPVHQLTYLENNVLKINLLDFYKINEGVNSDNLKKVCLLVRRESAVFTGGLGQYEQPSLILIHRSDRCSLRAGSGNAQPEAWKLDGIFTNMFTECSRKWKIFIKSVICWLSEKWWEHWLHSVNNIWNLAVTDWLIWKEDEQQTRYKVRLFLQGKPVHSVYCTQRQEGHLQCRPWQTQAFQYSCYWCSSIQLFFRRLSSSLSSTVDGKLAGGWLPTAVITMFLMTRSCTSFSLRWHN